MNTVSNPLNPLTKAWESVKQDISYLVAALCCADRSQRSRGSCECTSNTPVQILEPWQRERVSSNAQILELSIICYRWQPQHRPGRSAASSPIHAHSAMVAWLGFVPHCFRRLRRLALHRSSCLHRANRQHVKLTSGVVLLRWIRRRNWGWQSGSLQLVSLQPVTMRGDTH